MINGSVELLIKCIFKIQKKWRRIIICEIYYYQHQQHRKHRKHQNWTTTGTTTTTTTTKHTSGQISLKTTTLSIRKSPVYWYFTAHDFDSVDAITWMYRSTIGPAGWIIHRMSKKAENREKRVENSTIRHKADVMLFELCMRQVSQTSRAALYIHTYSSRDQRVREAFGFTFYDMQCSIMSLNALSYVQGVLGGICKTITIYADRISTVFEVLL